MQIALYAFLLVVGLVIAILASGRAVDYTRALAAAIGAPPFVVGVALVSIGTDLPEIANSIVAHLQGEGDVNVGDSVGSALTQYTLVLGLFPLIIAVIPVTRRQVGVVSLLTIVGLGATAVFVSDGWLGRWEGVALVAAWAVFTVIVVKSVPGIIPDDPPKVRYGSKLAQVGVVLLSLGIVGVGATLAVRSLIRIAEIAGVSEFVIAFFGLSFGTSTPELVVDVTALLRGAPGIALGDALGSSLVDATLSIGAGPIVAPAEVTAERGVTASLYTILAVAVVGILLAARRRHDRWSGPVLIGLYIVSYFVILGSD
ncbi:MAG: sodium:calcium antiporter [Actinomycetota bacterium]|nr:sodium:calcium antiporter [Actinomycetota bacterium]